MDTRMTIEERQAFLAETHVGVLSIPQEGRGPLTVPVWYTYQPGGDVRIWTGEKTRKARLLQKALRVSFFVQDPTPPNYKYVSIEGPFVIQSVDLEGDIHPMSLRYFGLELGEENFAYICRNDNWRNDIMVCITPERWLTVDYNKLGPPPN